MKRRSFVMCLPLLLATLGTPAAAQPTLPNQGSAPELTLDAGARAEIVAELGKALRRRYVFPEVGERTTARIEAALAAGGYDRLSDPAAFAVRLTDDAYAVAHDKHLKIWAGSLLPPPPGAGARIPPADAGITRADRLTGGLGYIEVIGFPPQRAFKPVLDRAMTGLAGSKALIVDVRRNGGGTAEAVSYLVSFLVAPDLPIDDIVARVENTGHFTRQSFRSVATPVNFAGVPIYILTSKDTFSGAEAFAYDAQALKRGIVIGEVTGGGANPTALVDLTHGFGAGIPFARAENAITKTNWDGRGVQPDILVPAADALAVALEKAGQKPASGIELVSLERVFEPRSTPLPGTEAALRHVIEGYASGSPDYAAMTAEQAEMTRRQLPQLQAQFAPLGELKSMKFRGPLRGGDEYELHFGKGDRMMALALDPAGKILAVSNAIPLPVGQ